MDRPTWVLLSQVSAIEAVNEAFFKLEDAIHSARRQQEPCMNERRAPKLTQT